MHAGQKINKLMIQFTIFFSVHIEELFILTGDWTVSFPATAFPFVVPLPLVTTPRLSEESA
jgi:hypothetical protein